MDYSKVYHQIINNRKGNKPTGYTENHHIIPKSLGGTDDLDNIVELTAREHFICHWLLLKTQAYKTKGYYSMLRAFLMMVRCNSITQNRYITSRNYEKLKLEFNELQKNSTAGEGNSQYGTIWVYNEDLQICKKILKNSIIENGWQAGRRIKWNNDSIIVKKCVCCNIEYSTKGKYCSEKCKKGALPNRKYKNGYTVFIGDIEYKSISEAADTIGIGHETARMRFKSKNFSEYKILEKLDG